MYLEFLIVKVYIYLNCPSSQITNNSFKFRKNNCNLKNVHLFESQNPRTKR